MTLAASVSSYRRLARTSEPSARLQEQRPRIGSQAVTDSLLLSLQRGSAERTIQVAYDDQALIADLADVLGELEGGRGFPELLVRSRSVALAPGMRVNESGLRSGDTVQIQWATKRRGRPEGDLPPAQVRFLSGSRGEAVVPLRQGVNIVGRGDDTSVLIDDGMASRHHVAINITDVVTVTDLGSTNGTLVNGEPLNAAVVVGPQDVIEVGDTRFVVLQSANPRTGGGGEGPHVRFNRPPRVVPPYVGVEVEIPAPPGDPPRQRLPMVAALIPVFLAVGMYLLTRNVMTIAFMAMSPVMMLGSYWEGRRGTRADHSAAVADWQERVSECVEDLTVERAKEIERRRMETPALGETRQYVHDRDIRLWERGVEDRDFLAVRVGIADLPSRSSIKLQSGGSRSLRIAIEDIPEEFAVVPDVPLNVDLLGGFGLGITGPPAAANGLARFVVAQTAALHSPAELVICAALGEDQTAEWEWLRWLPHVHNPRLPVYPLATEQHHVFELLEALRNKAESDRDDLSLNDAVRPGRPHYLLLLDDTVPVERSRIVPILKELRGHGVSFVWVGAELGTLPRPAGAVVEIASDASHAVVSVVDGGAIHDPVAFEMLTKTDAEAMARQLAPIIDATHADAGADLPETVSLPELFGGVAILDETAVVRDRWHESGLSVGTKSAGLRAVVGMASAPLTLDIRRDGPHALVAGTTGAGKSEFLQSWVASLAATHPPERVTFLYVDYKGGSAFKDCIDLPHTVGLVTDLDAHQVQRALTSLNAELHRRERILNQADAKDLVEMESMGHPDTPPNLLIIVDEFAALAKEVPEFVDGVVNIAQRGRSLGLHLVLATQRPAGVVTDNIRANTNLRVALRMADEVESTDVVGSPLAASFSRMQPGRAVARIGPKELVTFQSGFAGARTRAGDDGPMITLGWLHFDGIEPINLRAETSEQESGDMPIDLERLVRTISAAHRGLGARPLRRPWQDPLPEVVNLTGPGFPTLGTPEQVFVGVRDEPQLQGRSWVALDPEAEGSWLIVGTSGSGKTVFLRSVAAGIGIGQRVEGAAVYGLDFSGRGLQMLEDLPFVGSVVAGTDTERVARLLRQLDATIRERSDRFAQVRAGTLSEYRSADPTALDRRIFVLLDGVQAFLQAFERVDRGYWIDLLPSLVAAGRQVGVHFVITADRRTGIPMALTSNVQRVFTLRLTGSDDYAASGVPGDILNSKSVPGRGIDGDLEVQVGVPGGSSDGASQGRAITELAQRLRAQGIADIPGVGLLPSLVPAASLSGTDHRITVGMSDADLKAAEFDPAGGLFAVFGPGGSGKSTALHQIAAEVLRAGAFGKIFFASARRREASTGPWDVFVSGPEDAASMLTEALDEIRNNRRPVVFIDDVTDLLDSEAGFVLNDAVRSLREHPGLIVVSGDAGQARRGFSDGLTEIRAAKTGLLLQPDFDYDGDLLGAALSRPGGRTFPPGRGYLVTRGVPELIQTAIAETGAPR